jgi:hypothetical protein
MEVHPHVPLQPPECAAYTTDHTIKVTCSTGYKQPDYETRERLKQEENKNDYRRNVKLGYPPYPFTDIAFNPLRRCYNPAPVKDNV